MLQLLSPYTVAAPVPTSATVPPEIAVVAATLDQLPLTVSVRVASIFNLAWFSNST